MSTDQGCFAELGARRAPYDKATAAFGTDSYCLSTSLDLQHWLALGKVQHLFVEKPTAVDLQLHESRQGVEGIQTFACEAALH